MQNENSSYEVRVQRLNETPVSIKIDRPEAALNYWRDVITKMPWYDGEREQCVVLVLNTRLVVVGHSLVGIGTLNEAVVHCREVFRCAIALNAYGVLVIHNHPSNDPSPSEADVRLTRRLAEAGKILQIVVSDSVIVGSDTYYSFRESGIL